MENKNLLEITDNYGKAMAMVAAEIIRGELKIFAVEGGGARWLSVDDCIFSRTYKDEGELLNSLIQSRIMRLGANAIDEHLFDDIGRIELKLSGGKSFTFIKSLDKLIVKKRSGKPEAEPVNIMPSGHKNIIIIS